MFFLLYLFTYSIILRSRRLRRWSTRLLLGKPSVVIKEPFDLRQATTVLNGVMQRGTFVEINQVTYCLGQRGYTIYKQGNVWQIIPIASWEN